MVRPNDLATAFHNYIFVHGSESLGKEKLLLTFVTLTRKVRYKRTPLNFIFSVFLGQDDLVLLIYQNYFYTLRYRRENGHCGMKFRRHFFLQVAS